MYYTSLLAYRFGGQILDHIFLRGKNRSLLYLLQRRPDPECFCAMTDAGPVCILTDFYGTSVLYLPNSSSCSLQVKPLPRGKGSGLYLRTPEDEERLYFYLLPGQEGPAGAFVCRWFSQPAEEG